MAETTDLSQIAQSARRAFVDRLAANEHAIPWWTAVIITASSGRQAERYRNEIERRRLGGKLPGGVTYLVVPDLCDVRIGSGGATINAVRELIRTGLEGKPACSLEKWWRGQRVLMIHSGGDSRRLPAYSLSGKLFSALPVKTPWGEVSTVFDETLALSTAWAARLKCGLVVSSGDVILTFPEDQLDWDKPGVCGAAMRQPVEVGSQHGVYVVGDEGRVYSFLQKPSAAEVKAAGGMLPGERVALDIGLLKFDEHVAAGLTELAGARVAGGHWVVNPGVLGDESSPKPVIDLYEHMTLALTGEWAPDSADDTALREVARTLHGVPFWCSIVDGDFTHVGTTSHFQRLMTGESSFSRLYTAQQRLGAVSQPGIRSAGVVVDSVLADGSELGAGSIVIECSLRVKVRVGRGAILHGLSDLPDALDVPDDVVVHQAPVTLEDGTGRSVIRLYGVQDDPKLVVSSGQSTWFGKPMLDVLSELGLDPEEVWPSLPVSERCLWNADLFVCGDMAECWQSTRWLLRLAAEYNLDRWRAAKRLSLASSAKWADSRALADLRSKRLQSSWKRTAVALAKSGSDIKPLLAFAPGIGVLGDTGLALRQDGDSLQAEEPTEAASRFLMASRFLAQAGLEDDANATVSQAFRCVQLGVDEGFRDDQVVEPAQWRRDALTVSAPIRVDFGGGWSDTPPFCLDWGGTVLNMALTLRGQYPIKTTIRRVPDAVIRCVADNGESADLRTNEDIAAGIKPGSALAVPGAALRILGIARPEEDFSSRLRKLGGGLEIRTYVDLPMGSGLGTSSILSATVLKGLAEIAGIPMDNARLSDRVMSLEQLLTTGGGWQDQAGGIFPGAKLLMTGPGLRQRLRVQPLQWTEARQQEFLDRFVLYYTGVRRMAKNLLAQVVSSYLAREVATVQVLHSIKTLATEMAYAMIEGEWDYLGQLLNRHWQLNQILDPHTTNAPIEKLLGRIRPWMAGAKLAGAGGGGFLMILTKGTEDTRRLRKELQADHNGLPGDLYDYEIAADGLQIE